MRQATCGLPTNQELATARGYAMLFEFDFICT